MSILDDIKQSFRQGDNLMKLIYVNLGVFLLVHLVRLIFWLYQVDASMLIVNWLAIPADTGELLFKPWTLLTYMFLHKDFFHILWNMITLYFAGRLFLIYLGEQRLVTVYIYGGIAGALLYVLAFNIFPLFSASLHSSIALGASASVLAVLIAIATYIPNFAVRLFFLIEIKLKYIAIFFVITDIISIPESNAGGHIAHLGGALFGYMFAKRYQRGIDWSLGFYRWISAIGSLFKPKSKSKMKVAYKKGKQPYASSSPASSKPDQDRIDRILDKISKSGYDSLTKEEKDLLFKASKE